MTDQDIVTLLLEHFKCRFPQPINHAADLLAMENNLLAFSMDLCRQLSEAALKAAGTGYQGTALPECVGQKARFVGYRNREVHGLFGKISVKRAYDHSAQGGTFPLDPKLGIDSGITPS